MRRNWRKRLKWLAAGCVLLLSAGCCHERHAGPRVLHTWPRTPECSDQAAQPDESSCPVYAKFHPVPTQPVFSPRMGEIVAVRPVPGLNGQAPGGVMPAPPTAEPLPAPPPNSSAGPQATISAQPPTAPDPDRTDWLFAPRIADDLIQKSEPSAIVKTDPDAKPAGQATRH